MTAAEREILARLDALTAEVAVLNERLGDRLLTRKEAAARAKCSTKTIKRREDEGLIRRVPGASRPLYHPAEVDRAFGLRQ